MAKYIVGSRVRLVKNVVSLEAGDLGTVNAVHPDTSTYPIWVDFDCGECGWPVKDSEVEPVFNIGDTVELINQSAYAGSWTGPMMVTDNVAEAIWGISAVHPTLGLGCFGLRELRLVGTTPTPKTKFAVGDRVFHNDPMYRCSPGYGTVTDVLVGDRTSGIAYQVDCDGHNGSNLYFYESELTEPPVFELVPPPTTARAHRAYAPVPQTILKHLQSRGSISPTEALLTHGIARLASAIHDLRSAGYQIETELKADAKGHRYARYSLA